MNMGLPSLIEIVPLASPVRAAVSVPGSKSITNRVLILAALREGKTELRGALWSEDTQVMAECLSRLGFEVDVALDPAEPGNRIIQITGQGGRIPSAGNDSAPLELFVGNAGTAARFLAAFVCLGNGVYRLSGVPRMHQRPQAALFQSLRQLGYRIEAEQDRLPAIIRGDGPWPEECEVSIKESSQFASALLLSAGTGKWKVHITGENADESPYVAMTSKLISQFRTAGEQFCIEPDASSASYFWGANWLLKERGSEIQVADWMTDSLQIDARFPEVISRFPSTISRRDDLGDSIMTAIVLAPFAREAKAFTELGRLRVQECERVEALKTELQKCGGSVIEDGDTLRVHPGPLNGAIIETYNDHRMAMCFATLGLKVPGIKLKNPACVKKTFPNFFQKLAAEPPHGLGAVILDGETGRRLGREQLYAE